MKFDKELWEKVTEYHGHKCPGIAMGFKMCEAAILEMDANPSEDEVVCISENKTCPVDAVRFIFGCTEDNQKLEIRPSDDLAFSFFNKTNGEKLKVQLKELNKDKKMDKNEFMDYILNANAFDLVVFSDPVFEF